MLNEGGDRDKLGRGWVWEGQIPMCIHQNHVFRARLYHRGIEPRLVSTYGNAFGQPWFVDEGKQTTNLASISKTKLSRFPVPIPPAAEQVVLAERVFTVLATLEQLASRVNTMLEQLARCERAAIAKAFRGELVRQDPTDEPASILLDRIRAARATEPDRPRRGQGQRADDGTVAAAPTSSNGLATNGPPPRIARPRRGRAPERPATHHDGDHRNHGPRPRRGQEGAQDPLRRRPGARRRQGTKRDVRLDGMTFRALRSCGTAYASRTTALPLPPFS